MVTLPYQLELADDDPARPGRARRPSIASQGVSVDADSGALDTDIDLPSYNPNVPALVADLQLDDGQSRCRSSSCTTRSTPTPSVPTTVNATLTFNSHGRHDLVLQHEHLHPRRRPADRAPGQRHQPEHRPVQLLGPGRRRAVEQHDHHLHRHGHGAQPVDRAPSATAGRSRAWSRSSPTAPAA